MTQRRGLLGRVEVPRFLGSGFRGAGSPEPDTMAEIREDHAATWIHTAPLVFPSQPSWAPWRRTPASRPDFTRREVAREVYALVIAHLTDRIGSRALIEREAAHSGGSAFQNPAHVIIPLADSIRRALREPANRQVVWHHEGIFPSTVTAINKADVPIDAEGYTRWRARLELNETQNVHVNPAARWSIQRVDLLWIN